MRHFIVNHTKLYGEPGRTTNTTVAECKAAVKKSPQPLSQKTIKTKPFPTQWDGSDSPNTAQKNTI